MEGSSFRVCTGVKETKKSIDLRRQREQTAMLEQTESWPIISLQNT